MNAHRNGRLHALSAHSPLVQLAPHIFELPCCLLIMMLLAMLDSPVQAQKSQVHSANEIGSSNSTGSTSSEAGESRAEQFGQNSLSFEPNVGQDKTGEVRSDARYIAYGPGYLLRLEPTRASLQFQSSRNSKPGSAGSSESTLGLRFVDANEGSITTGNNELQGKHSYLPDGDPKSWTRAVPLYARVTYGEIYPRTNLTFYGNNGHLEYDLVLRPGADPTRIELALEGAGDVQLEKNGDISITVNGVPFRLMRPLAYQPTEDGGRLPVRVNYKLENADASAGVPAKLSFGLGEYDRRRPLVIDPVLIYGTYIPGAPGYPYPPYYFADTYIDAMTADSKGNTYLAVSVGSTSASYSILKYDPNGNLLLNVSLGSPNVSTTPSAIGVDSTGNIFVAGSTSPGMPVTANAYQQTPGGNSSSGFLTVVKSDGSSLLYSSYLGGAESASIAGMVVGPQGQAFVTGSANGAFPTTSGAYLASSGLDNSNAFVAELNPSLSGNASLVWSTMLTAYAGSGAQSSAVGITVDSKGNTYVVSNTYIVSNSSPGFPVTSGAYAYNGIDNNGLYVTKLNSTGSNLIYSAFLGPGNGAGIAVDGSGAAYVTGSVGAADFPVTAGAYQTTSPSGFAAKLSSDGTQLLYSTFLGNPSSASEQWVVPTSIALQPGCISGCNAYVTGLTTAAGFPVVNPVQAQPFFPSIPIFSSAGSRTGFLVNLAADGKSVAYSTYLGALSSATKGVSSTPAVAVDTSGNVYFATNIYGPDAPATLPAVQNPGYGFLAKLGPSNAGAVVAAPGQVTFLDSLTQSVTLRNVGSGAVELQRPFVFSSAEFSETDSCPSSIPAGSACTLHLNFVPTANGPHTGTLTITSNAHNSPAIAALSVPTNQTNVSFSASAFTFSDQVVNTASATQVVHVTNEGNQAVSIGPITASETDYLITSTCPAQLAAGASCTVGVTFLPTQIGLRSAYLDIPVPGIYTIIGSYYLSGVYQMTLTGTGVLSASGTGAITLSESAINFGSVVENSGPTSQSFLVINSGETPVTINSITVSTAAGKGKPGDFSLVPLTNLYAPTSCGAYSNTTTGYLFVSYLTPFDLAPQSSCAIYAGFQPSIAGQESGTVTISDSAAGSPHIVSLSGIGLYSAQSLVISPSTMTFPPQPVGDPSATQTFYVNNSGGNSVLIDRAITTGDFNIVDNGSSNCEGATVGSCSLSIAFTPTVTGARTGTLTFYDSLGGTPLVFNLAGTGIQATGTLVLGQSSLAFPAQAKGTTSASQQIVVTNPGNSPITINAITTTGDFAAAPVLYSSANCGGVLSPDSTCVIDVVFSPTQSSGTETGTVKVHSTAGTLTVDLSGQAIAAAAAVQITASAAGFGSVQVGTTTAGSANEVAIYVNNTGDTPVTFPNPPVITGISPTPSTDFSIYPYGGTCQNYGYIPTQSNSSPTPMPLGASCSITLVFNPSLQATESATFTLVDSAGTQTIHLTGTGTAKAPAAASQPATVAFRPQPTGSSSASSEPGYVGLYNTGTTPLTIKSVAITAGSSDFSIETYSPQCAGMTIQPGYNCTVYVAFAPSAIGYRTGAITFKDSGGNSYVTQLAGYAIAPVNSASLTPQGVVLPDETVGTIGAAANFTLTNTGNVPFVVGTVTGKNVSISGSSTNSDFFNSAYSCTGSSINPGGSCPLSIFFAPQSLGAKSGSVSIPITYASKSTATFTATVSGTGIAATASANLYPQNYSFSTPVAPASSATYQDQFNFVLTNTGTVSLTVGNITGQDITGTAGSGGDFVYPTGYYSSCAGQTIPAGGNCYVNISFIPLSAGTKSGAFSLPVTYANGAKATFTATFSGTAVAPTRTLQVAPTSTNFNVEVVGTTDWNNAENITVLNIGNSPVTFRSVTTSNASFTILANDCPQGLSQSLYPSSSCSITVAFTPLASIPPGTVTGALSIADNATGSPHTVQLSGTAISAAQDLGLSQTSVTFGSYAAGITSPPQIVYFVDLGSSSTSQYGPASRVQINSIKLGGTNPGDFVETNNCGGTLGFTVTGRSSCEISVAFSPAKSSSGVRNATVTITPAQGSPLVIQLTGKAVAQAPAIRGRLQMPDCRYLRRCQE